MTLLRRCTGDRAIPKWPVSYPNALTLSKHDAAVKFSKPTRPSPGARAVYHPRRQERCRQANLRMRADARLIFTRRLQTPGRWVFPATDPGRHIGQHQRLHAAVVKRSGVFCVPYDFRHTFASRAANDEGMPLAILAKIMGHANLRSIMKYVHTSQEHMDREMVRLDARSSAGPVTTGPNGEEKGKAGIEQKVPSTAPNLLN